MFLMKLLGMGAEAKVYAREDEVVKKRVRKGYRIKELDERIRKQRTKTESRLLRKALRAQISVPQVRKTTEYTIRMDYVKGPSIKKHLNQTRDVKVCEKIGESLAKLHDYNIIHGDLTTSNMVLKDDEVYFIDFGLGDYSQKIEDKAVDVHLFKQALKSKHAKISEQCYTTFLKTYSKSKHYDEVMKQLKKVEGRGRYK